MACAMSITVCMFRASSCGSFPQPIPRLSTFLKTDSDHCANMNSCLVCGSETHVKTPTFWGEFFLPYSGLGVSLARQCIYYPHALWLVGVR